MTADEGRLNLNEFSKLTDRWNPQNVPCFSTRVALRNRMRVNPIQPRSFRRKFSFVSYPAIVACSLAIGLAVLIATQFATPDFQSAIFSFALISTAVGIWTVVTLMQQLVQTEAQALHLPMALARDECLFSYFVKFSDSLLDVSYIPEPVFRQAAIKQLESIYKLLLGLSQGTLVFDNTESWRLVYEQLLLSKPVYRYRSVAWIKDEQYWQDEPGRQSLQMNLNLAHSGQVSIERICIIRDVCWLQPEFVLPPVLLSWTEKQAQAGVDIKVIRESALAQETDLVCDFGIYGDHAIGHQLTDDNQGNTRFVLQFDFEAVALAESKWRRLQSYAVKVDKLSENPP